MDSVQRIPYVMVVNVNSYSAVMEANFMSCVPAVREECRDPL